MGERKYGVAMGEREGRNRPSAGPPAYSDNGRKTYDNNIQRPMPKPSTPAWVDCRYKMLKLEDKGVYVNPPMNEAYQWLGREKVWLPKGSDGIPIIIKSQGLENCEYPTDNY